ncbi:MAG: MGH1-like glycoside hydrolase domain-containing protein [Pyrinomonadaceae bacterium]
MTTRTVRKVAEGKAANVERQRLAEDSQREYNWKRWGPYLSERQWGTVREDYSANGDCWNYFPHDQARSRAFRWGEDGLLGITDRECRLCFALALWNGRDPILKERLFGLTNNEGNHGEDVKECYFYLDSTPTHSYMRALYKYPQSEFPYQQLIEENKRRGKNEPEFELTDTGIFDEQRYFDVFVEYAKASADDVLIRLTIANRAMDAATLHVLPTLWFRNTWAWGREGEGYWPQPRITRAGDHKLSAEHSTLGKFRFEVEPHEADSVAANGVTEFLFTDNETNAQRLYGSEARAPYVKDAFHELLINGRQDAVKEEASGTKAAAHYALEIPAQGEVTLRLRLRAEDDDDDEAAGGEAFAEQFDEIFAARKQECDEFYKECVAAEISEDARQVMRQAYAGLLWSKQFYQFVVKDWLEGDPGQPAPPAERSDGRNHDWNHLFSRDIVSMPDKWEYPWFAAWDLAFHMISFAKVDMEFAKQQLLLFSREWYMHPNGQLPAYEFAFGDVNPPVHAWAAWRIYNMADEHKRDRLFLERVFQKLMLNFTWWVNRKDPEGKHIFAGGFLGLDNIGVFDRSQPLPHGVLEQADGTAWMAFYCATMLSMALELARENPAYEDIASKFFEHFVDIVDAMNKLGGTGLWNEDDGFYYDSLRIDGKTLPLKVRSMVGLIPLFAVENLEEDLIQSLPGFSKRMNWFLENRGDLAQHISYMELGEKNSHKHRLLAVPSRERLTRVLRYVLDESEFLSPYGIRSLSRFHKEQPYVLRDERMEYRVEYTPGESNSSLFGGNSNWRGPIWFPLNYLLIESLGRYHHFYGDNFRVECPVGSGQLLNLAEVAAELNSRLASLFLPDENGRCAWHGLDERFARDPHWRGLTLFYEYFHGDTGEGLGASHQTGWTALVTRCIEDLAKMKQTGN